MQDSLFGKADVTPVFWIIVFMSVLFATAAISALIYAVRKGIFHEAEDIKYRILEVDDAEDRFRPAKRSRGKE